MRMPDRLARLAAAVEEIAGVEQRDIDQLVRVAKLIGWTFSGQGSGKTIR
jgi:hypothetical protein